MGLQTQSPGFGWTNEYLVSALPWVTGSLATTSTPKKLSFPKVTKYIKVRAGGHTRVGFTSNGVSDSNYFVVPSGTIETFDVRVREMYVRADTDDGTVDVFAGLTIIDKNQTSPLTGSSSGDFAQQGEGWQGVG